MIFVVNFIPCSFVEYFFIISNSVCVCVCVFVARTRARTHTHTLCVSLSHIHTIFPTGFWPLSQLLPAAWAPSPFLGRGSVAGMSPGVRLALVQA